MTSDARAGDRDHRPTVLQLAREPLLVWAGLLALLAITVAAAYAPIEPFNAAANLLIAAIMVGLLAAFLLDLRWASTLVRLVAASGLFWLVFMLAMIFVDYLSRS
jgi:cytochrome c oxidase subunit 4